MRRIRDGASEPWPHLGRQYWTLLCAYHRTPLLFSEDVGTTPNPILARLASTSGTNDVRDFWNAFDIPVVSLIAFDTVVTFLVKVFPYVFYYIAQTL